MGADAQRRAVVHQPVEHVGRLVAGRRHDPRAVRPVLVGNVGVEAEAGIVAIARVDVPGGIAALAGAKELPVRGRGTAIAPDCGDGQGVVRVDDPGERRPVGLGPDMGVGGPDQLVAGDPVARRGHAAKAEIGGVRQDRGQQGILVLAALAGAQVGEGRGEARCPIHLVQQFGNADARHQRLECVRESTGFRRGGCLDRRDLQAPVVEFDPLQLAAPQPPREAFQTPVELGGLGGQPRIGRRRQAELGDGSRHSGDGQEIAVEPAMVGRALDPDVARAQLGGEDLAPTSCARATLSVERSSNHRRFDSFLLAPVPAVPAAIAELGLPATADAWLRPPRPPSSTGV